MKFYIFSAQYLPTVGGVERYSNSLAKELINKGHSVTIVTSSLPYQPEQEIDSNGVNIIRLPVIPLMSGRFPVLKQSKQLKAFKKVFSLDKPDFCVIQTRFYINSIMAAHLCKKHNVPAIVIDHSTSHLMRGGIIGLAGNIYEHLAAFYLKSKINTFYGVSQRCVDWLNHFGINNAGILYNSIDINAINQIPIANKLTYVDTPEQILIVFSARLIEEKGVNKIIEAFNNISSKVNAKLVIAGTGPLFREIQNRQHDRITVTGALSYNDVIGLYKCADIFCLPTDYPEGFPTTVLESAACKTMLIASDKGGTSEIIIDDSYGILLKENTINNIEEALLKACRDKTYRQKCVDNAHKRLLDNFTWDKTCEKVIDIATRKQKNKK